MKTYVNVPVPLKKGILSATDEKKQDPDPDPYQNVTDPQYWLQPSGRRLGYNKLREFAICFDVGRLGPVPWDRPYKPLLLPERGLDLLSQAEPSRGPRCQGGHFHHQKMTTFYCIFTNTKFTQRCNVC